MTHSILSGLSIYCELLAVSADKQNQAVAKPITILPAAPINKIFFEIHIFVYFYKIQRAPKPVSMILIVFTNTTRSR